MRVQFLHRHVGIEDHVVAFLDQDVARSLGSVFFFQQRDVGLVIVGRVFDRGSPPCHVWPLGSAWVPRSSIDLTLPRFSKNWIPPLSPSRRVNCWPPFALDDSWL